MVAEWLRHSGGARVEQASTLGLPVRSPLAAGTTKSFCYEVRCAESA
jgi:hypothetical protein